MFKFNKEDIVKVMETLGETKPVLMDNVQDDLNMETLTFLVIGSSVDGSAFLRGFVVALNLVKLQRQRTMDSVDNEVEKILSKDAQ